MGNDQYQLIKQRLEKGEAAIKDAGGFLKAPKHWVKEFQRIAELALMYEIENNLLPI